MSTEPILHVDIDSFYASVEVLKDPSLAGKPVVVGGPGARGVVASASYEARKYGVRSAMPAVRARRLCPDIVFLPSDFEAYRAHPHRFREVLCSYTPLVEPISLDEAFLDVSGATMLFGSSAQIAAKIRADVEREVGVTCSVGVAPSKFVAKLASDDCKPNGMLVVPAGGVQSFLEPLPVGRLWGVGRRPARRSADWGSAPSATWAARLSPSLNACSATRRRITSTSSRTASTTATDPVRGAEIGEPRGDVRAGPGRRRGHPAGAAGPLGTVAARLRADGYRARTVVLKARLANFQTLTRSRTLSDATDIGADLYHTVAELYGALPGQRRRIRLLGVQASGLVPAGAEQLAMLHGERWGDVERVLDRIELRFGRGAARPASLIDRDRRS